MPITRFAPSPTGFLHIGGARTCLFNWLYARNTGGKFILRIEDTDIKRSEQKYLDEILDSLKWLGMDWDELYHQAERFPVYLEYAEKLLKDGLAYREDQAIIFRVPENRDVTIHDLIHDKIVVNTETIKDQVLIKSDGSPAYNFCCAVDDALMGVTHVIRGDDHISNTPKQVLLYEALGFNLPKFAHIPMILGEDKARLSKRHGATAISEYRRQGYLPEALVNYLALLGWNPGNNRELFSRDHLVKQFSMKRVNNTAAIFDVNKLNWINGQYIKTIEPEKLTDFIEPLLKEEGYIKEGVDRNWLTGLISLYKTRLNTLQDFSRLAGFFFNDQARHDEEAVAKFLNTREAAENLDLLREKIKDVELFTAGEIEKNVRELVEQREIPAGQLIHPARVALTGGTVSPGIFEVMEFLGKDKCLIRMEDSAKKIRTRMDLKEKLSGL